MGMERPEFRIRIQKLMLPVRNEMSLDQGISALIRSCICERWGAGVVICLEPRQLLHGTERRVDRAVPKCVINQ